MADVIPGVYHQEDNCRLFAGDKEIGTGIFYITENEVLWKQSNSTNNIHLSYKCIGIHAVSKDTTSFPHECLYVMYNGEVPDMLKENEDTPNNDDEDCQPLTEFRIVPQNTNNIKRMFDKMSDCQCLHPDDEDSDDSTEPYYQLENGAGDMGTNETVDPPTTYEGGAGEGFYTSEEGFQHLTPQGQVTLQRLQDMLDRSQISQDNQNGHLENIATTNNQNSNDRDNGQFDDA